MIWHTRLHLVTLLLALAVVHAAHAQDDGAKNEADSLQNIDDGAETPADVPPAKKPSERGPGELLSQSILPGLGPNFSAAQFLARMFPAISQMMAWGQTFPGSQLLSSVLDEQAAASKVILVLAEDRDAAASANTESQQAPRTVRQNDFLQQIMQTLGQGGGQPDFSQGMLQQVLPNLSQSPTQMLQQAHESAGQVLGQAFPGLDAQNPGQMLAQAFPGFDAENPGQFLGQAFSGFDPQNAGQMLAQALPGLSPQNVGQIVGQALPGFGQQNVGQIVGQAFPGLDSQSITQSITQAFPGIDLSQFPGLGPMLQQGGGSVVGAPLPSSDAPADEATADEPAPPPPPSPPAPAPAPSAIPQFPRFQQHFERSRELVGQALGQGNPGGLFNFRAFQPWAQPMADNSGSDAQASEVSEVRVRPDSTPEDVNAMGGNADETEQKMAEMKMKAALHEALKKKTIPILWFRMPSPRHNYQAERAPGDAKTPEDAQIEAKLHAFERQVIMELMQLQELERQAKEIRAASESTTARPHKDSPYKLSYSLSKTPVHKITRADVEKALNDTYMKKLIQKASMRGQHKDAKKLGEAHARYLTTMPAKRQTESDAMTSPPKQISKEDMVKMLAYAYRMASARGEELPWMKPNDAKTADERQWIGEEKNADKKTWNMQQQRQWIDMKTQHEEPRQQTTEQRQMPQSTIAMNAALRQWAEQQQQKQQAQQHIAQQRQWADEKMREQPAMGPRQMTTQERMAVEAAKQRLLEEQQKMKNTAEQRQWAEDKEKHQSAERQWAEDKEKQQIAEQRQWAEEKAKHHMAEQRQWTEDKEKQHMAEQRQWAEDKEKQHMAEQRQWAEDKEKHQSAEQRQWAEDKEKQHMAEQRQWAEDKEKQQIAEQRQWAEDKEKHPTSEQRQWAEEKEKQQIAEQRQRSEEHMRNDQMMMQRQWAEQQKMPQPAEREQHPASEEQRRQWIDEGMRHQNMDHRQMANEQQQMPPQQSPEFRQWIDEKTKQQHMQQMRQMMPMQHSPMPMPMQQQRQMATQMPTMHMRQWADQHQEQEQQRQMMMAQMQQAPHMAREMQAQPMVGEATPQMPENAGQARFKGSNIFDEFDLFETGGKKGKNKGGHGYQRPATVINYYYNQGGSKYPSYGGGGGGYGASAGGYGGASAGGYGASAGGYGGASAGGYGASSGGYGGASAGGYGSSAGGYGGASAGGYGASAGGYGGAAGYGGGSAGGYGGGGASYGGGAYGSNAYGSGGGGGSGYRAATGNDEIETMLRDHNTLQKITAPAKDALPPPPTPDANPQPTTAPTTTTPTPTTFSPIEATTPADEPSDAARLATKFSVTKILGAGRCSRRKCVRCKRNANYGTLETIDEMSLADLRKTYKSALKEITLQPDEDPAEALMRYNADSIREALERASEEPVQISGGQAQGSDGQPEEEYETVYGSQEQHQQTAYEDGNYEAEAQPDSHASESVNRGNATHTHSAAQNSTSSLRAQLHESLSGLTLDSLVDVIKDRLEHCCARCKEQMLQGLRNMNTHPAHFAPSPTHDDDDRMGIRDKDHAKWLGQMASKGYDPKYLTRSHQLEYMRSGRLGLVVESEEEDEEGAQAEPPALARTNDIAKRTIVRGRSDNDLSSAAHEVKPQHSVEPIVQARAKGKAFTKSNGTADMVREYVHAVNTALGDPPEYTVATTLSPYALRGKFVSSKSPIKEHKTSAIKFSRNSVALKHSEAPLPSVVASEALSANDLRQSVLDLVAATASSDASKKQARLVELVQMLHDVVNGTEVAAATPVPTTSTIRALLPRKSVTIRPKRSRTRRRKTKRSKGVKAKSDRAK